MNNRPIYRLFVCGSIFLVVMLACSFSPQVVSTPVADTPAVVESPEVVVVEETPAIATPTDTLIPTIVHLSVPGEPPGSWLSEITDRDTSAVAAEKRALGGENFSKNLFERPFNANAMDQYFADLDITRARLFEDAQWVYVSIRLAGKNNSGFLGGNYGVEVDLDVDGRGDLLIFTGAPGAQWSTDGVRAWLDNNNDVGSSHPVDSDAPGSGDGYESLYFDAGLGVDPDAAWVRLAPDDPAGVQIAFKLSLLNNDTKYTWGVWTDRSILNPAWFDYNDHFTAAQAGSSLVESSEYPIKGLYELDNTCRWAVGFTPTGSEPGICPVPVTPTSPPPVTPGKISGIVFYDGVNGDLVYGPGSSPLPGLTVRARSGTCSAPGGVAGNAVTNVSGFYTLTLNAGTYCVDVHPAPLGYSLKTPPQTVTVPSGGSVNNVNFGFSTYLGMR